MNKVVLWVILAAIFSQVSMAAKGNEGGGGGNTLNGKPIESYVGDVTSYPSYKKVIVPMLERLNSKLPGFTWELKSTATDKLWYFVPTKLDLLPNNVTGIDFKSDQVIVQSKQSVWVNKKAFEALGASEQDQSTLILHELVMGVMMRRRKAPLTAADHDSVRAITIYLAKNQNASAEDLSDFLKEQIGTDYTQLRDSLVHGQDRLKEFFRILKFTDGHGKAYLGCDSSFTYDEAKNVLQASISDRRSTTVLTITQAPEYTENGYNSWMERDWLKYTAVEGGSIGSDGELRRGLFIGLDSSGILFYGVNWFACEDPSHTGQCTWTPVSDRELKHRHLNSMTVCQFDITPVSISIDN